MYQTLILALISILVAYCSTRIAATYTDILIHPLNYVSQTMFQISNYAYMASNPEAIKLYTDFKAYKSSYVQPTIIIPTRSQDEKALISFHGMLKSGLILSPEQMTRYNSLLELRAGKIERDFDALLNSTLYCFQAFIRSDLALFKNIKRSFKAKQPVNEKQMLTLNKFANEFSGSNSGSGTSFVQSALLSKSCVSKVLIHAMDSSLLLSKSIAIIIPVHKEFNRLKKASESPLGEDFLNVKYRELQTLFEGTKKIKWSMVFVDDQPINEFPSTAETIRNILSKPENKELASHSSVLTYADLQEQVQEFNFPDIPVNINEFAKQSRKGGAVYAALRKLASTSKAANVLIYTDADISTSLLQTGTLIAPLFPFDYKTSPSAVSIGSRRSAGAVMVRNEERNLMSLAYNMMTRVLFNLDISDTQMGFKALLPEVVMKTSPAYSDIGMAFDVELLWLAQTAGFKLLEVPCVWIDSDLESQSSDQGLPMFQELWQTFGHRKEQLKLLGLRVPTNNLSPKYLEATNDALIQKFLMAPEHETILELAANPKFAFIIREFNNLYTMISPQAFKDFIDSASILFESFKTHTVSPINVQKMINSFDQLMQRNTDYELLFRFLGVKTFPEIGSVVRTLLQDHELYTIILPLMTGDNVVTSVIHMRCPTFYDFVSGTKTKKRNWVVRAFSKVKAWIRKVFGRGSKESDGKKYLSTWIRECNKKNTNSKVTQKIEYASSVRSNRVNTAVFDINSRLKGREAQVFVTTYISPEDQRDVKKMLSQKFQDLMKEGSRLNVKWTFIIATSQNVDFAKTYVIDPAKGASFRFFKIDPKDGKAVATRKVFSTLIETNGKGSYFAYVDLSQKISMSEMWNLLSKCLDPDRQPCVSIGSRRLPDSTVTDKPVSFLARSTMFNLIIKFLFPNLYQLSDTQTGFKLFSSSAWRLIEETKPRLESTTLAFDVEILQQASRNGIPIYESPVDFADNTLANEGDLSSNDAGNMFQDLINIRGRLPDTLNMAPQGKDTKFFSAGAESIVYLLSDGSLIKIPHEKADPDFAAWLKYFIFKDRKPLTLQDQSNTVLASSSFTSLLNNPRIKNIIPALRQWKEFNAFIMKIIAAYENKNYKSAAYSTVWNVGKDLIVPYRILTEPFSVFINSAPRKFDISDDVKQVKMSKMLFNDAFKTAIDSGNANMMKGLICEAISLTFKLWRRGLFDLDTNFMVDMGFYPLIDKNIDAVLFSTIENHVKATQYAYCLNMDNRELKTLYQNRFSTPDVSLMVIDPGELVSSKNLLDIAFAKKKLVNRYDYLEMRAMLEGKPFQQEIEKFYLQQMENMFDLLAGSLNDIFGSELSHSKDFSIQWIPNPNDPLASNNDLNLVDPSNKRIRALKQAKVGYQTPYLSHEPTDGIKLKTFTFFHPEVYGAVPIGADVNSDTLPEDSYLLHVRPGSIEPILAELNAENVFENNGKSASLVLLDGGTATRAGIIKYANYPTTKGNLFIHNRPLCHHIHDNLMTLTNHLSSDYLVLSSCDDLLTYNRDYFLNLANYISSRKTAFFWFDNDNPDSDIPIYPMTAKDMKRFVLHYLSGKSSSDELNRILKQVPPANGPQKAHDVSTFVNMLTIFYDEYEQLEFSKSIGQSQSKKEGTSNPLGPLMPTISDYLRTWMSYHSMIETSGPKTPFLFVIRKNFAKEILDLVRKHFYDYQYVDMTWESTISRAFKSDKTFWNLNKPSSVDIKAWTTFYDELQIMKKREMILSRYDMESQSTRLEAQREMRMRIFPSNWNNFDDPFSIYSYFTRNYMKKQNLIFNMKPTVFIQGVREEVDHDLVVIVDGDRIKGHDIIVEFSHEFGPSTAILKKRFRGEIVLAGCQLIPKRIRIDMDPNEPFWRPGEKISVMIYNLHRDIPDIIEVYNNNYLVEMRQQYFMTNLLPVEKAQLKTQPIYRKPLDETQDWIKMNGMGDFLLSIKYIGVVSKRVSDEKISTPAKALTKIRRMANIVKKLIDGQKRSQSPTRS